MKHATRILLTAAILLLATSAQAAKMYRWVDKDGNVHYSDKLPPEASQQERQVLNEQGVTTETLDRQLTDEEIAEKNRLAAEEEAKQFALEERRKHDDMLRQSYTSVADMEESRDGRITAIESQVLVTSRSIATLEKRVSESEAQAKQLRDSGKEVPQNLRDQINDTRDELLENQKSLMARRTEQEQIRQQFDEDIARFKEITGKQ
ncbi:MAG: DUF4124 domain-containing protein [Gammaproteobacteria bacterium]